MANYCFSSTLNGIEARLVRVEVAVSNGLPGLTVVGLPDAAVSEAGARVRSALAASGFTLPPRRLVVNLSPADLRKQGSGFDLALALGLLEALGELPEGCLQGRLVVGELSLDGSLRPVRGLVPALALAAQRAEVEEVLTAAPGPVLDWKGARCHYLSSLDEAVRLLRGEPVETAPSHPRECDFEAKAPDMAGVYGQALARWALEVSAAGGHHLMMAGPPGCGKSLLASCLPGLLPPLAEEEFREVATIKSVCNDPRLDRTRPFRSPGPGTTPVALLGGYLPGEVTRAHHGVLFLDEFPEFRRDALEGLRQVLEEGEVVVARARFRTRYPARFTLLGAMNPCPCGYYTPTSQDCTCSQASRARYMAKFSGPLKDRFDMFVTLERQCLQQYLAAGVAPSESSGEIRQRVTLARQAQAARGCLNRDLKGAQLRNSLGLEPADRNLCSQMAERLGLSVRAFEKWLKVARTAADLEGKASVGKGHLMSALCVRYDGAIDKAS